MDQKRAPRHATSSKKIVAVHPTTNGQRLAEPLLPAACSSRPLAKATPGGCGSSQRRSASLPAHPPLRTPRRGRRSAPLRDLGGALEQRPRRGDGPRLARRVRHRQIPTPPPPPQPTSPRRRDPPGRTVLEPPPRRRREVAGEPIRLSARCRPPRPPPPQAPGGGGRCRRGPTRRRLRSSSSSQAAASNRGRSRTRRATACVAVAAQAVLAVARGKRKGPVKWRSSADEGEERGRDGSKGAAGTEGPARAPELRRGRRAELTGLLFIGPAHAKMDPL